MKALLCVVMFTLLTGSHVFAESYKERIVSKGIDKTSQGYERIYQIVKCFPDAKRSTVRVELVNTQISPSSQVYYHHYNGYIDGKLIWHDMDRSSIDAYYEAYVGKACYGIE